MFSRNYPAASGTNNVDGEDKIVISFPLQERFITLWKKAVALVGVSLSISEKSGNPTEKFQKGKKVKRSIAAGKVSTRTSGC